jgi:ABC-type sugar transport system substrate-binding protein
VINRGRLGAIVVALAIAGGCASAPAAPTSSAPAAAPSSAPPGSAAASGHRLRIGYVVHAKDNEFIRSLTRAAQDAGEDLGVDVVVEGTTGVDGAAQLAKVEQLFASGVDAVATSVADDSMAAPLNELIRQGKPIVTFNRRGAAVAAPFVGEDPARAWKQLGRVLGTRLGAGSKGNVLIGSCQAGVAALEARAAGLRAGLQETAPGVQPLGLFQIGIAPQDNIRDWTALQRAHPDAAAIVGLCAPDLESLGGVNAGAGDRYVMAGASATPGNLKAIADGHAFAEIGQTGYVQGYLPIRMLVDHLRAATPLAAGFVDSGVEIATRDSVTLPYGLTATFAELSAFANDPARARTAYAPLFASGGQLATWSARIEPLPKV